MRIIYCKFCNCCLVLFLQIHELDDELRKKGKNMRQPRKVIQCSVMSYKDFFDINLTLTRLYYIYYLNYKFLYIFVFHLPLEWDLASPCRCSTCNCSGIADVNQQCSSATQRFPTLPLNLSRTNLLDPAAVIAIHATGGWRVANLSSQEITGIYSFSEQITFSKILWLPAFRNFAVNL